MAQLELDHHHLISEQEHPALSAVPKPPGPELDPKHHDASNDSHRQTSTTLPPPPLFSPPPQNHSTLDDDTHHPGHQDISPDISLSHSSYPTNDLDLTLESSQNNSTRGSVEPHTPEPVAPNLSFINFVTGQTPSLSLHTLGESEDKILKPQEEKSLDRSVDLETEDSVLRQHVNHLADQVSMDSQQIKKEIIDPFNTDQNKQKEASDDPIDHKPPVSANHLVSEALASNQSIKSLPQNASTEWVDISKPEFQFAIGLFAVPWYTSIILSRVANQLAVLAFSQPIFSPVSGLFTSILAPIFLYSSLVTLLITSFDHLH